MEGYGLEWAGVCERGETLYNERVLGDNRGREERDILREFWQLYVLRDGCDLSCVTFADYVVEMVLESFFVGRELGHALGEVDGQGAEAIGFEVDFLVVGDLPDCAGKRGRVSWVDGSMGFSEWHSSINRSINSDDPLSGISGIPRSIAIRSNS